MALRLEFWLNPFNLVPLDPLRHAFEATCGRIFSRHSLDRRGWGPTE